MTSQIKVLPRPGDALILTRIFRGVPDDICQFIINAARPIKLMKNQRLIERGDVGGAMYVVQSGRIEISVVTEGGRKLTLNLIGPGHCFGEISMIDNGERTASAVAIGDARLQPISRATYFEAVRRCPELAINMMEILCERVRSASELAEEVGLLSLSRRLARRILVLHENFVDSDGSIEIAQGDLADFAGATRESTNKILMLWKSTGLIDLKRRKIYLHEIKKLDQLAYGD